MKRKLVSGAGKSRGEGPKVLTSPPLLPLTRLGACFAGKRSLARRLAFAEVAPKSRSDLGGRKIGGANGVTPLVASWTS